MNPRKRAEAARGWPDDRLSPLQRCEVRRWMRAHVRAYLDDCNEVNLTKLAEDAAHEFEHDDWLDVETHEVWELAVAAAQAIGA